MWNHSVTGMVKYLPKILEVVRFFSLMLLDENLYKDICQFESCPQFSGGSRGGGDPGVCPVPPPPPSCQIVLNFMQFSGTFNQILSGIPLSEGLRPPPLKSWIRHAVACFRIKKIQMRFWTFMQQ